MQKGKLLSMYTALSASTQIVLSLWHFNSLYFMDQNGKVKHYYGKIIPATPVCSISYCITKGLTENYHQYYPYL